MSEVVGLLCISYQYERLTLSSCITVHLSCIAVTLLGDLNIQFRTASEHIVWDQNASTYIFSRFKSQQTHVHLCRKKNKYHFREEVNIT